MTREEMDFIGSMNMCDEISNEAYRKIMTHCEEQEPCDDCISRQAVIDEMGDTNMDIYTEEVKDFVRSLPPVTPRPKVGRWLDAKNTVVCSECGEHENGYSDYCPNCGAKMEVEG